MEDRLAPARYELTPGAFSWAQAQSIAVSRGGNLVTINDAAEEAAIQAQFGTGVSYWIGLSDAKTEGQFVWADGQVTSYRDWEAGEPNDFGGSEDYAVMNFGPARKWNDVGNGEIKYGVIEIPDGTSPPPTSPPPTSPPPTSPPPTSPPPTSPPPGSYALTSRSLTWPQAQAEAASRGGNLVTVNSAAEEAALQAQFGTSTVFWIGLSDAKTEGQFAWADGQVTAYRNWEAGEPNNYGGDEDYAGMNYGPARKWNDIGSNTYNYGIIEFPSVQPGTVGLRSSVVDVSEAGGRADLIIDRTGGSAGTITVDYRTVAGTSAAAGADYTAASGTLTFGPGETTKTVSVPILNDALVEGTETFGFAIDNVTGGGTLGAPRTATVNIQDDESPLTTLFAFTSLTDPAAVSLNGPARLVGGAVRLTEATNQAGSAFHPRPLEVTANTSFAARFSFRITGGTGGADGLTFAVHNAAAGSRALGGPGGSLGYAGIDASLAVEFDTYQNAGDANANAVSVLQNGNTTAPLVTAASPVDLNGGQRVYAWVDYDGAANRLDVFVSNAATKPTSALLTRTVDLATVVGPRAFVGFTSGTGGLSNVHEIIDWTLAANSRLLPAPSTGVVTRESVASGFVQPTALDWTPDGRNLYVAEQRGVIRVLRDGVLQTTPFLDFTDRVNGTRDRGLLDIAVHPQFPTQPYVYLLYTYDPPEVYQNSSHPLAGPDKSGNRAGRLTRVTANAATNYTTIVANSEVVLVGRNSTWANFNGFVDSTDNFTEPPAGIRPDGTNVPDFIATDSQSHTVGAIEFGTDGLLYATIGDGTSYNRVDPRTVRVQDVNNLSGKVLRIDPLTGNGVSSNPFWNGDAAANRSKVYQLGLRNGFRTAIDRQTNRLYVGDVGWTAWEEINAAGPGANFGWPYYEGGSGNSLRTGGYQDLSQAQAFYAAGTPVTPSLLALNHAADGINAIVMGDVYRATAYPAEFQGNIFFNDLGQGIVRAARINASGGLDNVRTFTTGATYVVAMKVGPDGLLYFVDLDDGTVGRWRVG